MFKVGDRVNYLGIKQPIHPTLELNKTYVIYNVNIRGYICVEPNMNDHRSDGYLNYNNFKYDEVYYRKQKLEKICSKLEIE